MKNPIKKKLFIFDFDGVLVDSVNVKTEAFAELYRNYGDNVVQKVVSHHLLNGGMSRYEKFRYYHSKILGLDVSRGEINSLSKKFSKLVVKKVVMSKEIEGAVKFLKYCAKNNIVCAINSATPLGELKYIISQRGWDTFFQYVCGYPSTKTTNIMNIVELSGINIEESVFFGDALNDYYTAKEVGIDFIGINYFLSEEKHFPCFKNFSDYLKLF